MLLFPFSCISLVARNYGRLSCENSEHVMPWINLEARLYRTQFQLENVSLAGDESGFHIPIIKTFPNQNGQLIRR